MTNRCNRYAPRLISDWPRLKAECPFRTVNTVNAVVADIGDVEAPITTAGGQVGGIAETRDRQTTSDDRQTLEGQRGVMNGNVCRRSTNLKNV